MHNGNFVSFSQVQGQKYFLFNFILSFQQAIGRLGGKNFLKECNKMKPLEKKEHENIQGKKQTLILHFLIFIFTFLIFQGIKCLNVDIFKSLQIVYTLYTLIHMIHFNRSLLVNRTILDVIVRFTRLECGRPGF